MDSLKTWLVEVAVRKMGPSAIRAALGALVAGLIAHAELLEKLGIVYDKASNTILVHLTTTAVWADAALIGLVTMLFTMAQHHAAAALAGTPQSGDVRTEPEEPLVGGTREGDLK